MPAYPTSTYPPTRLARRVGLVSTYPPRLCGLATFAAALEGSLIDAGTSVTMVTIGHTERSSPIGSHELLPGDRASLDAAAAVLSRCDVAIVQHEYGVYGGPDGDEVLDLLRRIEVPTVVVLHTVPTTPSPHQRFVLESVAALAAVVVVMTDAAEQRLVARYAVDAGTVATIPHGAWTLPKASLAAVASPDQPVRLLTWGLLGPGKGIEHMIRAMAILRRRGHDVRYTVAGATHPNVLARDGNQYRDALVDLARTTGVAEVVRFDDTYRDLESLGRLVRSADLVILPYDSPDQVTSGVLVDAVAAGKPVIATAFPHAVELLAGGAGMVVAHSDPAAIADAIDCAVSEPGQLAAMSARARELAPSLGWRTIADRYRQLCDQLVSVGSTASR